MKREPIKSTNKPKKIARKTIKGIDSVSSVGKPKKWKRVKIAGNLVSDDGGGLEGLIGLEVMEDYGNNTVTKDKKATKRQWQLQHNTDDDNLSDYTDKKRKTKKVKKKPKLLTATVVENGNSNDAKVAFPGRFVLLPKPTIAPNCSDSDDLKQELSEWKSKGVPDLILQALAEKGFNTPTDIQSLTLSAAILGRKDILGAAETGSGKTLAFGIPILNGILQLKDGSSTLLQYRKSQALAEKTLEPSADPVAKSKKRQTRDNCTPPPEECNNFPVLANTKDDQTAQIDATDSKPLYALILTPTRELAVQVKDHLKAAAKYTGIQVAAIFGGLAHVKQERVLRKCPEIVVATPGRLWELISEGNPHLNKLENLNFLVIDETDRMVEKGHFDELKLLLGRLNADPVKKSQRQNFVFSATLSMVHDLPGHLQTKKNGRKKVVGKQTSTQKLQHLIDMIGMAQPKIVDITQKMGTATLLTECRITCQLNEKDLYLYYFLQRHPGRTIVFCNSVDCVRRLAQLFAFLDCQPRPLHAHMNQRQRLKNLERFTASDTALLVATDVAARGLDIPNVQHVIHYQVPRTSENYVHRSGRTARAKTEGLTLLLMEPSEIKDYVRLCRTLGRTNDLPLFPVSERHLKAVRARVDLARQVDVLELKVRRKQCDIGWLKKSANEMDIIVDDMSDFSETELYDSDDGGDRHKIKRQLKQKRDALTALLSKSLFPKGFSYKYPTSTGQLDVPSMMDKDNAVDLMKTTIESNRTAKNKVSN